jgi:hypothetical protein
LLSRYTIAKGGERAERDYDEVVDELFGSAPSRHRGKGRPPGKGKRVKSEKHGESGSARRQLAEAKQEKDEERNKILQKVG